MGDERIVNSRLSNGQLVCLYLDRPLALPVQDEAPVQEPNWLESTLSDPVKRKYHSLAIDLKINPNTRDDPHISKEHMKRKRVFDKIRMMHEFFVVAYEGIWQAFEKNVPKAKIISFAADTARYSRSKSWDASIPCLGISRVIYPKIDVNYSTVFVGIAGLGMTRSVALDGLTNFMRVQTALKRIYHDPLSLQLYQDYPDIFDASHIFSDDNNLQNHANNFSEYWRE